MHHTHRTTTRRTPSGQRALVGNRVYKITFAFEFCGDADGDALGLMLGLGCDGSRARRGACVRVTAGRGPGCPTHESVVTSAGLTHRNT